MKRKFVKKFMVACLAVAMTVTLLAGCGKEAKSDGDSDGKTAEFTWFINRIDSSGEWYETYEESPSVQYINQQYWDIENGGIGTAENGVKLNFSYLVPITGTESDNFNTMMSTGEYPEILDLAYSSESPQAMHDNGVVMDITEYVEKYMPNYMAYLDENPELKPLVQVADEEGAPHYYAIYAFVDGVEDPWEGTCYRRDWIVKYAEPTEYVWDWESDYVKENGHPAVTPLEKALEKKNMDGWKKNEVTSFSATYGDDPDVTYVDNVIFPSGTSDPLTISDWEWMFTAYDKAINERGWSDDSSAYGFSIPYYGYSAMGDIVSSFGGGTGSFYVKDGEVSFDGGSENFKTYLECMQVWYKNGWLDSQFNTRASDAFFMIDTASVNQGKVGMWCGMSSTLGTAIRTSCQNAEDQTDAYVMGCSLPINDVYGTEEQMYKEPDSLYQGSRRGTAISLTEKAAEKDEEALAALFTFFDWTYTLEGSKTLRIGLNAEQLASAELNPNLYEENNIETAYTEETNEDGKLVISSVFDPADSLGSALTAYRMDIGFKLTANGELASSERKADPVIKNAFEQWTKYMNLGNILDYSSLLNADESTKYSKINAAGMEYMSQNIPNVIKGTMSWEDYVKGLSGIDTETGIELLQKYVDLANTSRR